MRVHNVVEIGAGKGCEIPNFKGSYLGRFPLVSADFWTSDNLSERSRSVNVFLWNARARNGHVEATLNHPFPAQAATPLEDELKATKNRLDVARAEIDLLRRQA